MSSVKYKKSVNFILIILAVLILSVEVLALERINPDRLSTLTVVCEYDGRALENVELHLYCVASIDENANIIINQEYEVFEDTVNGFGVDWTKDVAVDLASELKNSSVVPVATKCSDSDGNIVFNDIPCGVYLLVSDMLELGDVIIYPEVAFESLPGTVYEADNEAVVSAYSYDYTCYLKVMDVVDVIEETPTATDEVTTSIPSEPPEIIAQTGQLWWPVPLLIFAGLVMLFIGLIINKNNNEQCR